MKPWVRRTGIEVGAFVVVAGAALWYVTQRAEGHPSALVPVDTSLRQRGMRFLTTGAR